MLVLSRKSQESVVISSRDGAEWLIKITVIGMRGGRVKLGFEAAADIPIRRTELWEPRHADSQPKSRDAAAKEAMEQWDDDGGAADPSTKSLATSSAAVRPCL
jgi:carbon storage regulator CsrA